MRNLGFPMPWAVRILADYPIVETVYTGFLGPSDLSEAIMETINTVLAHGLGKRLADCRMLTGGPAIGSLCLLADHLSKVDGGREIRQALVLRQNAKAAADVLFWETICQNRAIPVQIFKNRKSALEWLLI